MVESALDCTQNVAANGQPDVADLAAACLHSLARDHGFSGGNQRTAWVAARLFLSDTGRRLRFGPLDAARAVEAVAGGVLPEGKLAAWFRDWLTGPA